MPRTQPRAGARVTPLPAQPFFLSPGQRIGFARERFFGEGQRPTGLVGEAVIQSWTRCVGARRDPHEAVAFEPVTRSRMHATLARNETLLGAASGEIERLEAALGGTGCRVILTDGEGVVVHATRAVGGAGERVLPLAARVGVNLAESSLGTNALAVVAKTAAACTVLGAEHYFEAMHGLYCAGAPIRDGQGRLAGVLDLTAESRHFGFDAAALVGVYATAIENRLLQAGAGEHLVLQFQVCNSLLGSPLEGLAGVDSRGQVAWLNSTAQQLLGQVAADARDATQLFGLTQAGLMARTRADDALPLRLPNGLTVWMRARLQAPDGLRRAVAAGVAPASAPAALAPVAAPASTYVATPAEPGTIGTPGATLNQHTHEVIERTLADCGGNISRAARTLGVSRGLLYRRLRDWAGPGPA
jgi:sigma-54 dependent transcriptional regulator, acetoin dehydrogenase operon transcriptional activator AcoR